MAIFKITLDEFNSLTQNRVKDNAPEIVSKLNEVFEKYQINTKLRVCHFIAQLCNESGCFTVRTENLNYSASRLRKIFPKYFPTNALAMKYAGKPQLIANRVYANRIGNGNEASGDGWKYRGRGYIQLTGRANYEWISKDLDYDFINKPDDLIKISCSVYSAAAFWSKRNCNKYADLDDIKGVTKLVNGGYIGLDQREAYLKKCKVIFKGTIV